jgi:hypothetical protein
VYRFQHITIFITHVHIGGLSVAGFCCCFSCSYITLLLLFLKTALSLHFRNYRFKSPRILSKLLMSGKGGCSHRYPGIGNIAYVKDLMASKIATRTFSCSRFGAAIARGLGWVCWWSWYFLILENRGNDEILHFLSLRKKWTIVLKKRVQLVLDIFWIIILTHQAHTGK